MATTIPVMDDTAIVHFIDEAIKRRIREGQVYPKVFINPYGDTETICARMTELYNVAKKFTHIAKIFGKTCQYQISLICDKNKNPIGGFLFSIRDYTPRSAPSDTVARSAPSDTVARSDPPRALNGKTEENTAEQTIAVLNAALAEAKTDLEQANVMIVDMRATIKALTDALTAMPVTK